MIFRSFSDKPNELPEDNPAEFDLLVVFVLLPVLFCAVLFPVPVEGSVGFQFLVALYSFSLVLAPTMPSDSIPNFH
ncbi:hypothetical protein D3C76_1653360 [compost metagenome]